ncbi:protein FAM13A isoform X1 [Sorex araneus]|uniref:protein FAM13A isoform X1 n=1 Tax=Sorex araneus TaxID=42254 RepID=UPI002433FB82|nr:protein FAM13A isoform X1 [Sorex araneus]
MGAGALAVRRRKATARLSEDPGGSVAEPPGPQNSSCGQKIFGVPLQELQQRGLTEHGVPTLVGTLVDFLTEYGLGQEGLFRVAGSVRAVEELRRGFESGRPVRLEAGDVSAAASLLKGFVRELPGGLLTSALAPRLLQALPDDQTGAQESCLRDLLRELPRLHYCLLKCLCRFLRKVAEHQAQNRMDIHNLATVFGPSCFHVPPGLEGMKQQDLYNKIMAKILENYDSLFDVDYAESDHQRCQNLGRLILVKEASCRSSLPSLRAEDVERDVLKPLSPRPRLLKSRSEGSIQASRVPQPELPGGAPQLSLRRSHRPARWNGLRSSEDAGDAGRGSSARVSQVGSVSASGELLERTIRSAVEQHLFDVSGPGGQSSEAPDSRPSSASSTTSARQRRRLCMQRDEAPLDPDPGLLNKENTSPGFSNLGDCILNTQAVEIFHENTSGHIEERGKYKHQKSSTKLSELNENQEGLVNMESLSPTPSHEGKSSGAEPVSNESVSHRDNGGGGDCSQHSESPAMKIQEHPGLPDAKLSRTQDAAEQPESPEVALCPEEPWGEPAPPAPTWQPETGATDDACLSPQPGRLIRQLLDEDSDPLVSPRFYAYGQSAQYLDDTEVAPSPPNSHSFMRRRSSSLGSYDDEQEDLTPAQLTRRIQSLKRKIRKFEDRFEEERKYKPSHSDKAANPEVLKWTNDLAKFRKQLKDSKLKISEEELAPRMRQRSNTLPKSFGSQLEKEEEKKQELVDKATRPSVEATLECIQRKLQEKRAESSRPEDIKDMTKAQIANEKVALQKALLYYESVHGRPVTKNERQVMKPLYDRYRLVKQILSRVNSIPIIGSPSSKRRSPLLQPIIEGETASFFKEIKEEEEASEDDSSARPDFMITLKTEFGARCFLDQFEDDADGFISPMDDKLPPKCSQDTGLSNLHAAPIPELLEHLQEMREEKKRIRKKLRDFEDSFFRQHGRTVQKEDRGPLAEEYNEYKHIKAKLRLLEVLISKGDADSKSL